MQEFEEDLYAILGVEETATPEEIRKAYLLLAKKLHPDRYPNDPEQRSKAQSEFARVTRAHEVVSDASRKAEYDAIRHLSKTRGAQLNQEKAVDSIALGESQLKVESKDGSKLWSDSGKEKSDDENINIKWANKHLARADDLYRSKRYQEAETAMKEAIRLVPQEPRYHNKLAEIYIARGWRTLAMTEVQASLRINPKNSEAKVLEAKIRALTKEKAQAVRAKPGFLEQIKNLFGNKSDKKR